MKCECRGSTLRGTVAVPGSKSHTIRGIALAAMARGESCLERPLDSADTRAALAVYGGLGMTCQCTPDTWLIRADGIPRQAPASSLDALNSGTTLRIALGSAALIPAGTTRLTGDDQLQRRPCGPLIDALKALGADVRCERSNGCAPFRVRGQLRGGGATVQAKTSQYVTSLLLACPLAAGDSELEVPLLFERPYVQMTLEWLDYVGIEAEHDQFRHFHVPGGQEVTAFRRRIPADFSSATFFLAAGALPGNRVTCSGLDMADSQSDRMVIDFLREMGARITWEGDEVTVEAAALHGIEADLNDCPDALPMLAVVGCFADGTTRLCNVPQARIKETDRIAVMCRELRRLGGDVEELADGLVVRGGGLQSGHVDGHGDHRVVMSLAVAGSCLPGETVIDTAEAVAVTFPQFWEQLSALGGEVSLGEESK